MSASRRSNVRRSNVTACSRCRARKQRCDQNIPFCSNCERAGVECVGTDIDGSVAPRSYIKSLEDRVAELETQLAACGGAVGTPATAGFPVPNSFPEPSVDASSSQMGSSSHAQDETVSSLGRGFDIAEYCLQAASSSAPHSFGSQGHALLLAMLAGPMREVSQSSQGNDLRRQILRELPHEPNAVLPGEEAAARLVDTYFDHCEFFSPVLSSKKEFLSDLGRVYSENKVTRDLADTREKATEESSASLRFRAFIVFATAVMLLNRTDSSFPISRAEGYFATAMAILRENTNAVCTADETHLRNVLLLVQYYSFASDLSAAWHFLGLATRLALELGLHNENAADKMGFGGNSETSDSVEARRWLFWTTYTFERNICVILSRPFSIPDEAINTPLPTAPDHDTWRLYAIHLIKSRRIESEIYVTLAQLPALNGSLLDLHAWRESARQRLLSWRATTPPPSETSTQHSSLEIFDGQLYNSLVLLYYPSARFPNPTPQDISILAHNAMDSIGCYKRAFRDGHLRFYWRTVHNLFRSGVAVAFCLRTAANQYQPELDQAKAVTSINTCVSVLWAMVERYPPGRVYRDTFDQIAASVLRQGATPTAASPSVPFDMDIQMSHTQLDAFFSESAFEGRRIVESLMHPSFLP